MRCLIITSFGKEGYGHITRCIAISQALDKFKIKSFFLLNKKNKYISLNKIAGTYNWYSSKKKTLKLIKNFDFVILDSIKINKKYLIKIKNSCKLFYINDYHRWKLNDCTHIDWTLFAKKKINNTEIINPKFAALRKPFWTSKKKVIKNKIKNILIFFGGSDIKKFSIKITRFLNKENLKFRINVISPHKINLKNVTCHKFLNEKRIKNFLTKADIVITSGGQTLYEMACVGVPGIVISETIYDLEDTMAWIKKGSIIYAGKWKSKNVEKKILESINKIQLKQIRKNLSIKGQKTIDGKGGIRLVKKILQNVKRNF
jgi:UDP-2,4-diacetamido-2,4,6-trideoxy-beta-L-altropyranose hydrolase